MKATVFTCVAAVAAFFAHAQPSVFEYLQPQPKRVVVSGGFCEDIGNVRFVRKTVDGVRRDLLPEAYELLIASDGVTVYASDEKGERYAKATLGQLVKLSGGRVPCGTVTDWPQYRWRGLMHDCGRNYLDVSSLRKVLDLMAAYKLNLFHWHITDYYGWRLESKKYPALQAPWAFRRQMSRYYTQKEFREVLDYAKERGITVMPELDVPGHTLAFRKGLNIEHMAERRVKGIVCDLIDELCSLATPEEMPYIHLGTDEARTPWEQVPDSYCPAWAAQVRKNGRIPVGWTPGKPMIGEDGQKSVKMIWQGGFKPEADESAFDTVGLYFGNNDLLNILNIAAFAKPFRYEMPEAQKLGPVMCSWHDDMLGEDTSILLRNNFFAPAIVMYSSLMWERRDVDRPEYMAKLPKPGTADFDHVSRFENRIAVHRDRVLADLDMPFSFVRQTH
ncbi:MAG: family 20 glycosylhydrolase, partial [Kiritimatiellae bacterium]|nr:family 20 glycosylhydrolase [Kiritimatiellia bacterium]